MGKVIQFPVKKTVESNSLSALSFEEGEINMALMWPLGGERFLPLEFKAKDVELAMRAIRGDQNAFLALAEQNGYELA